MIALTILAGALSYTAVQFLWYAPFAFGREHIESGGMTESEVAARATMDPRALGRFFGGVVVPAFLASFALVALKGISDRLIGTPMGFFLLTGAMGVGVSIPKYLMAMIAGRQPDRLVMIHDGAMLCSLLAAAFAIILSTTA